MNIDGLGSSQSAMATTGVLLPFGATLKAPPRQLKVLQTTGTSLKVCPVFSTCDKHGSPANNHKINRQYGPVTPSNRPILCNHFVTKSCVLSLYLLHPAIVELVVFVHRHSLSLNASIPAREVYDGNLDRHLQERSGHGGDISTWHHSSPRYTRQASAHPSCA